MVPGQTGASEAGTPQDAIRHGLLHIAALFHGESINATNIAREAGVARTTVTGYLEILGETLLCFQLPAFQARLRVRERTLPKWYWCDPGMVRALKRSAGPLAPEERGHLFEGLVAQLIRGYRDYRGICEEFSYWASAGPSGIEVDFLLKRQNEFVAVEVKAGRTFAENWCKGLRAVAGLNGRRRRLVVYPEGPSLRTDDGIEVVQFPRFGALLDENDLWP